MSAAKRGGLPPSNLDSVEDVTDRVLLLSGRFDDRLKEIAKAKADAMPYIQIADTIEEARALVDAAEKGAVELREELDARSLALSNRVTELALVASSLDERAAKVSANETELAEKANTLERAESERSKEWDKAEAKFAAFEKKTREKLATDREALEQARGELEARQATFAAEQKRDLAQILRRTEEIVEAQEKHSRRVAAFEKEMKEKQIEVDGLKRDLSAKLAK